MQVQQQNQFRDYRKMIVLMKEVAGDGFPVFKVGILVKKTSQGVLSEKLDPEELEAVFTTNPATTTMKFIEKFDITHTTILYQLTRIEKLSGDGILSTMMKEEPQPFFIKIYTSLFF